MNSILHVKEKDCNDWMVQVPDDPTLYGIEAQFIRGFGMLARNRKVNRYIPIEKLRKILEDKLYDKCNVAGMIDSYLENEKYI